MVESVVVDGERRVSPTLEYPALEPWGRHEVWGLWVEAAMILVIGGFTGLLLTTQHDLHPRKLVLLTFAAMLVWLFTLHSSAEFARARNLGPVVGAILGTVAGLVVLSLINYWLLNVVIAPRRLLLMGAAAFVVAATFEAAAPARLGRSRRVLVMGVDEAAAELVHDLRERPRTLYRLVGVVDGSANGQIVDGFEGIVHLARRSGDLVDIVRRQAADVIVCSREHVRTRTVDRLLDAGVTTVRVVNTFDFYESAFGCVADHRMTKTWFTSVLAQRSGYSARTKRMLDIALAAVALLVFAPVAAAIAVVLRCAGGGPILFRQVRSGEAGKPFTMVKFRTMIPDAERDGPVWASDHDPRVTTVGRFLRKTRLDEVPQFWNVLRGEMSIVGPRPERPEYLDHLQREVPFWNRRLLLKPGITGWAQVHHAYTDDVRGAARKLAYDLYYLKHRSLGLDLWIVFTTFKIVLSGRGAR